MTRATLKNFFQRNPEPQSEELKLPFEIPVECEAMTTSYIFHDLQRRQKSIADDTFRPSCLNTDNHAISAGLLFRLLYNRQYIIPAEGGDQMIDDIVT